MISLAQALKASNARNRFLLHDGFVASLKATKQRAQNGSRAAWLFRRARQVLTENLKGIEDIFVRNTDSVLDYPRFGIALEGIPLSLIEKRITMERERDPRSRAIPYYRMYHADVLIGHGKRKRAIPLIDQVLRDARTPADNALKLHARLRKLELTKAHSEAYQKLTTRIYAMAPAALRNAGFRLPVHHEIHDAGVRSMLSQTAFTLEDDINREFVVSYKRTVDGKHELAFRSQRGLSRDLRVSGTDLRNVVNQLNDVVFREKLP
jgi:hypothetical protein